MVAPMLALGAGWGCHSGSGHNVPGTAQMACADKVISYAVSDMETRPQSEVDPPVDDVLHKSAFSCSIHDDGQRWQKSDPKSDLSDTEVYYGKCRLADAPL